MRAPISSPAAATSERSCARTIGRRPRSVPPTRGRNRFCSTLGISLHARVPTAIYWGPGAAHHVYNDAWAPIPAARHPGRSAARPAKSGRTSRRSSNRSSCRSLETGEGFSTFDQMLPMERGGGVHETYWNYSLTPVHAEDGSIAGVFNQRHRDDRRACCAERRRLPRCSASRSCSSRLRARSPCSSGPDHVFEIVNPAYLRLVRSREHRRQAGGRGVSRTGRARLRRSPRSRLQERRRYVGRAVPIGLQTAAAGGPEQRLLDFVYQPLTDARGKSTGDLRAGERCDGTRAAEAAHARERGAVPQPCRPCPGHDVGHRPERLLHLSQSALVRVHRSERAGGGGLRLARCHAPGRQGDR